MSKVTLQNGDIIQIKDVGVRFISIETNKSSVSLEDANSLLEKGDILAIQVEQEGEEFFMSIAEIEKDLTVLNK